MTYPDPTRRPWDPKKPVAPFMEGSLQHYPEIRGWGETAVMPEWREVEPWSGALTLVDYARGRSAAYFLFRDDQDNEYPMFLKDFGELVKNEMPESPGRFLGKWSMCKRGQNYGVQAVKP